MEIRNVNLGGNGVGNVNNRKAPRAATIGRTVRADSVDLSASAEIDSGVSRYEVDPNYPPRMDKLAEVGERIRRNAYASELSGPVAEALADSEVMQDVVLESAAVRSTSQEGRTGEIDRARTQAAAGYYDNPEVRRTTAENLLGTLGIGEILG